MTAYLSLTLLCAPAALALVLANPAAAQIIPTGTPAADITLSTAIADWRIFVTCSALDAPTHAQVLTALLRDTDAATSVLTANNVPVEAIAAFKAAASPAALTPAPDTPFEEVQKFCATQANWSDRWRDRQFTDLARALPLAFPKAQP